MNVKAEYFFAGWLLIIVMFPWPIMAGPTELSGKYRLSNQDILIPKGQKYHGRIDLRSQLPMGDEFVLTNVNISFKFQDDREWVSTPGAAELKNTGKITRHPGSPFRHKSIVGQTDYHYTLKSIIHMTNEEEVAELTIGRNKFFATSMRRRDTTREDQGRKVMMLGIYRDDGDNDRTRQHYRITEKFREIRRDGYDGLFEIRHKSLDLSSVQDLAHSGILDFELAGQGDYIFMGATVWYEGHGSGQTASDNNIFSAPVWIIMSGLPLGGWFWWQKSRFAARRNKRGIGRSRTSKALKTAH